MRLFIAALILAFPAATAVAGERTARLSIDNMYCALCPLTVATAIEKVDGVKDVSVDYKTKVATVVFDDARTTVEKVAAASMRAGYPAKKVQ